MRRFNWAGCVAVAAAAGGGFLAGEAVHRNDPATIQVCESGDLSEPLPAGSDAPPPLLPPQLVEEIDLSCPPPPTAVFGSESAEPPLAAAGDSQVRTVNFEAPAARASNADILPVMPYLTDDPEPALLPPLGDVPALPLSSMPDPDNPIFQAVKKFFSDAVTLPMPTDSSARMNELNKADRDMGVDWQRVWMADAPTTLRPVSDKVPLGKPPVSEHPSDDKPQ